MAAIEIARDVLARLQKAVASKDVESVAELFDDEVVLFGTAAESMSREQAFEYLAAVVAQEGTVRWGWDQVAIVAAGPDLLCFAVVGSVGLDKPDGQPAGDRDAFRATLVAAKRDDVWRLRHFHGSVPQSG